MELFPDPDIGATRTSKPKAPRKPSAITKRLVEAAAVDASEQEILFQHTLFCQTGMPYRDPGAEMRRWEQKNGLASLLISAGEVLLPSTGSYVPVGLPFGPKPRLILAHLNTEALRKKTPEIDAEGTLTRFVSHGLNMGTDGRTIRGIKEQLTRLSACTIRIGIAIDGIHAPQRQTQIVTAFDLWLEKDARQRVLWPATIRLSAEYFESLQAHAVPLDSGHLAALSHSALAIDLYSWLAQRLHRVQQAGAPVSWAALEGQFGGSGYERPRKFREKFNVALVQVRTAYKAARLEVTEQGLTLRNSPPPVPPRLFPTSG